MGEDRVKRKKERKNFGSSRHKKPKTGDKLKKIHFRETDMLSLCTDSVNRDRSAH